MLTGQCLTCFHLPSMSPICNALLSKKIAHVGTSVYCRFKSSSSGDKDSLLRSQQEEDDTDCGLILRVLRQSLCHYLLSSSISLVLVDMARERKTGLGRAKSRELYDGKRKRSRCTAAAGQSDSDQGTRFKRAR